MPFLPNTKVNKPWGHELHFTSSDDYIGKLLFIAAGEALSRQFHVEKAETIHVINGEMILEIGTEGIPNRLVAGDTWHIEPGTVHRFVAQSDVTLVEVSTAHHNDVVRLEDRYGRTQNNAS